MIAAQADDRGSVPKSMYKQKETVMFPMLSLEFQIHIAPGICLENITTCTHTHTDDEEEEEEEEEGRRRSRNLFLNIV